MATLAEVTNSQSVTVSAHTCLAVHNRTSIKSLEDMGWKSVLENLLCLVRDSLHLTHRDLRFPDELIHLRHHTPCFY